MAAKFGDGKTVAKQGGFKPPPPGYMRPDAGKPGGTPTGTTPMVGGSRMGGIHVPGKGSSAGKNISKPKPFNGGAGSC